MLLAMCNLKKISIIGGQKLHIANNFCYHRWILCSIGLKVYFYTDQEIDPMEIQVPEDENIQECTSTKEGSNHTNQARPFGKKGNFKYIEPLA